MRPRRTPIGLNLLLTGLSGSHGERVSPAVRVAFAGAKVFGVLAGMYVSECADNRFTIPSPKR